MLSTLLSRWMWPAFALAMVVLAPDPRSSPTMAVLFTVSFGACLVLVTQAFPTPRLDLPRFMLANGRDRDRDDAREAPETVVAAGRRVAARLGVPAPQMILVDDVPGSGSQRDGADHDGPVVVALLPALVDRLTADELDAVIAHELGVQHVELPGADELERSLAALPVTAATALLAFAAAARPSGVVFAALLIAVTAGTDLFRLGLVLLFTRRRFGALMRAGDRWAAERGYAEPLASALRAYVPEEERARPRRGPLVWLFETAMNLRQATVERRIAAFTAEV